MRIQHLTTTQRFFLSDGGLETFLIFEKGYELPCFSAAVLLESAQGRADLLVHDARATLEARSFPNGCHVSEVVVDPETGVVTVDRYTVVDDFGNLINPMLAEGQVHGGIAQGVGQALLEEVVYDESGQQLSASYMDYTMPRADDVPSYDVLHHSTKCTTNPLGIKGCGEAGAIGSPPAVINAITDAIGNNDISMPATPSKVWAALNSAKIAAE